MKDNVRMGRFSGQVSSKQDITNGKIYFVGIGIDQYVHWPKLQNAVRDVKVLKNILTKDYGFFEQNIWLLLNEKATEANIIFLLEDLANQVNDKDSLLIYYAGHGHLNSRGRGFWVPVDAPENSVFRYISNSTIKDYIGDINSLHTLLISDACFSGSLFSSGRDRSSELVADELASLPSRWAICSGRHDEIVSDGPLNGHSPFAESIIDVLNKNTRPAITVSFLVNQVIEQTRSNYKQLPDGGPLQDVGHKRGQFVFRIQRGLGADLLWEKIQLSPENIKKEIILKKMLIRQYAKDYPSGSKIAEVLKLGSQMEQKYEMLESWNSEFKLIAFIKKDTSYKKEAIERLHNLQAKAELEENSSDFINNDTYKKIEIDKSELPQVNILENEKHFHTKVDDVKKNSNSNSFENLFRELDYLVIGLSLGFSVFMENNTLMLILAVAILFFSYRLGRISSSMIPIYVTSVISASILILVQEVIFSDSYLTAEGLILMPILMAGLITLAGFLGSLWKN